MPASHPNDDAIQNPDEHGDQHAHPNTVRDFHRNADSHIDRDQHTHSNLNEHAVSYANRD